MSGLGTAIASLAALRRDYDVDEDINKVWYLRQNRIFRDATEEGLIEHEHIFTMCEMPRGTLVFDAGESERVIYFVKRGTVRIVRQTADGKDVTVALLGPGDIFGEESLFDRRARTTHAVVVEDALLCTSRADDLFALLSRDPVLALNVAKVLSERLDDAQSTMEDLAYARVGERIEHLYRKLALEHGVPVDGGTRVDVRLTHADIASLVGSTRETVSVEIAKLIESGRLHHAGRAIVVPTEQLT
jgi:CRP/FNR family transcriptional regulator